ncbi:efflux RND transporter periplasmic adaptor subunit [Wenzhouxiangellaceae bacterium CH-27]|uniref:Efflux RND transporter periplasmic adaptor subunit n=2 Tax=Elongatibacter sediminis TaxID=3119006 RepID=A0AAW9RII8_9GAMM
MLIFSTEPVARREAAVRETAMLVEVTAPRSGTFRPTIVVMGTVIPAREIILAPRVDGTVAALGSSLVPGGAVGQGEVLLRIDDADYRIALSQRESDLEQAIADLEIEQGRQVLAERDYQELNKPLPDNKRALVLREPHLRSARARIESAQAAVDRARLDLERTAIRSPFEAQVISRSVNVGSQVEAGDPLARLVAVDSYWVEVTIPPEKLHWIEFPQLDPGSGSPVTVRDRAVGSEERRRQGSLFRLIGQLEGHTRLARALAVVDDPLALRPENAGAPRLMLGTFVEVRIEGREIRGALQIPRDTLRVGNTVWLMREGRLVVQPVEVLFSDADHAYVSGEITADDRVVTSSLATVEEGVRLRTADSDQP